MTKRIKCPDCKGKGYIEIFPWVDKLKIGNPNTDADCNKIVCSRCKGDGEIKKK